MKRLLKTLAFTLVLMNFSLPGLAQHKQNNHPHEIHEHEDGHDGHHDTHDEQKTSTFSSDIAKKIGIKTAITGEQTIHKNILTYGNLTSGPEQLSHIRARYPGLIQAVFVSIGDQVEAGTKLAEIESNESLSTYKITSPIKGIVVQRHANTGEVTQEQVLFSVANFDTLWAELRIYSEQRDFVRTGQKVHFHINDQNIQGYISHVIPTLDQPYELARIEISNSDLGLSPGLLIEGNIAIADIHTKVAVEKQAIQTLNGEPGIFIKEGDSYHFSPVNIGESDHDYVEVIAGVESGVEYVTRNSYLIKADIEKSEAEHSH